MSNFQQGDWIELKDNSVFKEQLFEVIMSSKEKVMIKLPYGIKNALIPINMIQKHVTKKEFEENNEEGNVLVEAFDPSLFNKFDF